MSLLNKEADEAVMAEVGVYADRVLVRVRPKEDSKTTSGIITATAASENKITFQGEVLVLSDKITAALKSGALEDNYEEIGVGWTVLFSEFAGSDFYYHGVTYKVLRFTDIMGWLKNK